ncbi:MAG: LysR family transcriptional regulator [Alphaproteobacteria bacterium]
MELAQLHLVKQILETGSLSKTAMRLNRAQSVVSRQLAALERECGGRIFYRNGRGVLLTELGERVLPQIEVILAAAQDIGSSGARLREDIVGDVTGFRLCARRSKTDWPALFPAQAHASEHQASRHGGA